VYMDKLFDTLNSTLLQPTNSKKLNYAITQTSGYIQFLHDMLSYLADPKFEIKKSNQKALPPCINGMKITINSITDTSFESRSSRKCACCYSSTK
jgi:hypothetical protein